MKTYILFILWLLPTLSIANPNWGKIYNTSTQQFIPTNQLITELKQADIVLIGEQHNICSHHVIENWLLKQTQQQSVALEMLSDNQQPIINEVQQWLAKGGKTSIRRLPEKIHWNPSWDWNLYGQTLYHLLQSPTTILAASPSTQALKQANQFQPTGPLASNHHVQNTLAQIINTHHSSPSNKVNQQQFKDHHMSMVLQSAPKPAWLIAGSIHVSKQLGVPLFLQDNGFQGKISVLILTNIQSDIATTHADYIWYLPTSLPNPPCQK